MSDLSEAQRAMIYSDMRDGLLLPEIVTYTLGQCTAAIRALDDGARGMLVDDWLIAISSKYSYLSINDPKAAPMYKLIIETAKTLAKSFGEDAAAKRKGAGRSIYIRRLNTVRVETILVPGEADQVLGPKAIGVHVDTELQAQINSEVVRQLSLASKLENQDEGHEQTDAEGIQGRGEDGQENGHRARGSEGYEDGQEAGYADVRQEKVRPLSIAAQRAIDAALPLYEPLLDTPMVHLLPDITELLLHANALIPFEEDEGADFTVKLNEAPREYWASSRGRIPWQTTSPVPGGTHIPMTPTGVGKEIKRLKAQIQVSARARGEKLPMSPALQKAQKSRQDKAVAEKLRRDSQTELDLAMFPQNAKLQAALNGLL